MNLKEELEILRGEPIEEFPAKPEDVPCIEMSDAERLCKHPVVSVQMCTYNHEPYIRQAIESVMMQKTDFEFELIIGEDCSQDKTREICFEYQKKYPDKIRVLWWHENVSKLGVNSRRCRAHCRGEFIAICEGDDYWIDPLKLQKQVDVFRSCASVGLVACGGTVVDDKSERIGDLQRLDPGVVSRDFIVSKILRNFFFGVQTCSIMYRKAIGVHKSSWNEVMNMRFMCGDVLLCLAIVQEADFYFIDESMVAYRRHAGSVTGNATTNWRVGRDGLIIRYAYAQIHKLNCGEMLQQLLSYYAGTGLGRMPLSVWLRRVVQSGCYLSAVRCIVRKLLKNG